MARALAVAADLRVRVARVVDFYKTESLELTIAALGLAFGLFLIQPFDMVPMQYALVREMPEWAWGTLFLVHGGLIAYCLMADTRFGRKWGALAGFALWSSIFVGLVGSVARVGLVPVSFVLSLACAWVFVRLERLP